jgi:hypothetical protein
MHSASIQLVLAVLLAVTHAADVSSMMGVASKQPIKVIGAGLGRTSTLSLYTALNSIGYKTHHMTEVIEKGQSKLWARMFEGNISRSELLNFQENEGYNATTDFPGCLLYKDYLERNLTAKVILSVRDSPEIWAKSVSETIGTAGKIFSRRPFTFAVPGFDTINEHLWKGVNVMFDGAGNMDIPSAVAGYDAWIKEVKENVPPAQLLVHNAKEGWPPLCAFLGLEGADCPAHRGESYPWVNESEEMKRKFAIFATVAECFDFGAGVFVGMLLMYLASHFLLRKNNEKKRTQKPKSS